MVGYGALYRLGDGILFAFLGDDDAPRALSIDIDDGAPKWGDVMDGIVRRRDGRMGFIDLGAGAPPAMAILPIKSIIYEGAHVRVRIIRDGFGTKPPECVIVDMGTSESGANRAQCAWARGLFSVQHTVPVPLTVYDRDLFENACIFLNQNTLTDAWTPILKTTENPPAAIVDAFDDVLNPCIPLKNGGSLIIEEGETLTAIDVNTSGPTGSGSPLKNNHDIVSFNQCVLAEIAHHIQLRDLSGAIMIDLIRMGDGKNRLAVMKNAQQVFGSDPRIQVLGWTRGGFFELTRRRDRPSLGRLYGAIKRKII